MPVIFLISIPLQAVAGFEPSNLESRAQCVTTVLASLADFLYLNSQTSSNTIDVCSTLHGATILSIRTLWIATFSIKTFSIPTENSYAECH
jgi:hypothetical protein